MILELCSLYNCLTSFAPIKRAEYLSIFFDSEKEFDEFVKNIGEFLKNKSLIHSDSITQKIYFIRNEKVMLDSDLAEMYGVDTKVLIQAIKRNIKRFPEDFMFQLIKNEFDFLRSQIVTSKRGGRRYLPFVFTEQGVAMLSSILKSERAIKVNIAIMRAFVQLRKFLQSNEEIGRKLKQLEDETKLRFKEQEEKIQLIFEAIKELMIENEKPKAPIGFTI